jgi:hypothetical protein
VVLDAVFAAHYLGHVRHVVLEPGGSVRNEYWAVDLLVARVDFVPKTVGFALLKEGSRHSPLWGLRLKGFLSSRITPAATPFGLEANQGLALGQARLVP